MVLNSHNGVFNYRRILGDIRDISSLAVCFDAVVEDGINQGSLVSIGGQD